MQASCKRQLLLVVHLHIIIYTCTMYVNNILKQRKHVMQMKNMYKYTAYTSQLVTKFPQ